MLIKNKKKNTKITQHCKYTSFASQIGLSSYLYTLTWSWQSCWSTLRPLGYFMDYLSNRRVTISMTSTTEPSTDGPATTERTTHKVVAEHTETETEYEDRTGQCWPYFILYGGFKRLFFVLERFFISVIYSWCCCCCGVSHNIKVNFICPYIENIYLGMDVSVFASMYNNYKNCWLDAGNDVGDDQGSLLVVVAIFITNIYERKHLNIYI